VSWFLYPPKTLPCGFFCLKICGKKKAELGTQIFSGVIHKLDYACPKWDSMNMKVGSIERVEEKDKL